MIIDNTLPILHNWISIPFDDERVRIWGMVYNDDRWQNGHQISTSKGVIDIKNGTLTTKQTTYNLGMKHTW